MKIDHRDPRSPAWLHVAIDLDTGREFEPPYFFADDSTGEIRCYARDAAGRKTAGFDVHHGRNIRIAPRELRR